jgi:protein TonB
VTLLEPVLVPGTAEPVSQPRSRNEERARAAMPRPSQRETPPATIPALPELPADERRPFIVGAELPEPAATAPMEPAPAAAAPVAPARLNAGYLQNPAPRYPVAARRAGEQGAVTLRVLVSRDGSAARVDLEKSSGSAHLDAAARDAVKAWRFAPARRGGEPVESWMLVPVVFRLEGAS